MLHKLLPIKIYKRKFEIKDDYTTLGKLKTKRTYTQCTICRKLLYYALIKESKALEILTINTRVCDDVIYYYGCLDCTTHSNNILTDIMNCVNCKKYSMLKYFCNDCTKTNIHK